MRLLYRVAAAAALLTATTAAKADPILFWLSWVQFWM
jgi:hypothetical protein